MQATTIASDGIYPLRTELGFFPTPNVATTVVISENDDSAVCVFGCDDNGTFVPFPSGDISEGAVIYHGRGSELQVNVSGIVTNPVKILSYPVT